MIFAIRSEQFVHSALTILENRVCFSKPERFESFELSYFLMTTCRRSLSVF